jgi:hypothetical protein
MGIYVIGADAAIGEHGYSIRRFIQLVISNGFIAVD